MTIIETFLTKLGFEKEAVDVFMALTKSGPLTILELARKSEVERTRLYRLVDELAEKDLIEEVPNYKRRTYKAASLSTLEMMVKERELESETLSKTLPVFINALKSVTPASSKNNVVYYHGTEGIRQMTWHILRTKGLFYTYSYRFWEELLGINFTLSLNEELVKRKIKVHDIFSDQYLKYKDNWMKKYKRKPTSNVNWDFWHSRHISEKILKVDQNIDIYNDVVAYYHWDGEETFGVEIYNERVAKFHKQMHNVIWKMAKPTPNLDWTKEWEA